MKFVTRSKAEVEELRDTLDKARGFPPDGFPPDQEWARVRGIGATLHQVDFEQEPGGDRYALDVPDDVDELVEQAVGKGLLTANEKSKVDNGKGGRAKSIPQDWAKSTSPINGGNGGDRGTGNGGNGKR